MFPYINLPRFSAVVALLLNLSCEICKEDPVTASAECKQPRLASAQDRELNHFGEFRSSDSAPSIVRAAVSLKQHTFTEVGGDLDPDLDSNGERIAFASTRHSLKPEIYLKTVDGVAVTQLTNDSASDIQPTFSPDDSRIAFASDRAGNWDIWVTSTKGGQPVQITHSPADEIHPSWSPDGTQLVYSRLSQNGGTWEIWITRATGNSTSKFIGYGLFPEWSPVSDVILFQQARDRDQRLFGIWSITLIDGEPRYPTELASNSTQAMILPTWSPDGSLVAYVSRSPSINGTGIPSAKSRDRMDVWVMQADGHNPIRLTDASAAHFAPTFAADRTIYFTSNRSGYDNVWSLQLPETAAFGIAQKDGSTRSSKGSISEASRNRVGGGGL